MPTTFDIKINGLKELQETLAKAPEISEPIYQEAIVKSTAILAYNTVPGNIPWITGTLARSFNPADIGRLFARWYPRVNYASAVQFGMPSSPGRYVPAIGKRLVDSSRPDFGTWPGFRGRFYMEKIKSASETDINEVFRNAVKAVTERLSSAS